MTRDYLVLGPIEVRHDGAVVDIGSPKQRAVLGALLVAQGSVVSIDRLVDTVWADDPPEAATTSLQAYISNLRRLLRGGAGDPSPIERVAAGYRLNVGEDRLDLSEFGDSARRAQAAREDGRWDEALAEVAKTHPEVHLTVIGDAFVGVPGLGMPKLDIPGLSTVPLVGPVLLR